MVTFKCPFVMCRHNSENRLTPDMRVAHEGYCDPEDRTKVIDIEYVCLTDEDGEDHELLDCISYEEMRE